jgi:hypothetical protein
MSGVPGTPIIPCPPHRRIALAARCAMIGLPAVVGLCHTSGMKRLGKRRIATAATTPSAAGLRAAAVHQASGQALAAVATTGIPKGIYRFASHEEMNRATDEAMARAIALNVRRRAAARR